METFGAEVSCCGSVLGKLRSPRSSVKAGTHLGDTRCKFPIKPEVLGRDQVSMVTAMWSVSRGDRQRCRFAGVRGPICEVTAPGATAAVQPTYDTTIGNPTTDGTAVLTARDSFMRVAMIAAITNNRVFTVDLALDGYDDGWFDDGALTFETGANTGRTIEVKSWTQGTRRLELREPARLGVEAGDQFRVYPGCHKRILEDCRDKFQIPGSLLFAAGSAKNFRGEPYVPGASLTAPVAGA